MTPENLACKIADLRNQFENILEYVQKSAQEGTAAHEFEQDIFDKHLNLGKMTMDLFFQLQGSGDLGEKITLLDGRQVQRLENTHARIYRSIYGDFTLDRTVYGSREGQKIEFVPLDARLQLPESNYSYLLQKWDQELACEVPFSRVATTLFNILHVKQSTACLEHLNHQMAEPVHSFRDSRPLPDPKEEGEIFVVSADGKGIVMRREADTPAILEHHHDKGPKPNQKRMAVVGAIYSVDRFPRTPEEVLKNLFSDPRELSRPAVPRPEPVAKHLWASLNPDDSGGEVTGTDLVFDWLQFELDLRNKNQERPTIYLMDGQVSLWDAREQYLPEKNSVEIIDLLHVTPRLWDAGHLFFGEKSPEVLPFVRDRLLRVLQGDVLGVVLGLRRMGTVRGLKGEKMKRLATICGYLEKNASRMRYDEYLGCGYPIASGVIEGACRHYVKDRMERSGMHWTKKGAQAMLDLRSEFLNGDWETFQNFRIAEETRRLYPDKKILEEVEWALAV